MSCKSLFLITLFIPLQINALENQTKAWLGFSLATVGSTTGIILANKYYKKYLAIDPESLDPISIKQRKHYQSVSVAYAIGAGLFFLTGGVYGITQLFNKTIPPEPTSRKTTSNAMPILVPIQHKRDLSLGYRPPQKIGGPTVGSIEEPKEERRGGLHTRRTSQYDVYNYQQLDRKTRSEIIRLIQQKFYEHTQIIKKNPQISLTPEDEKTIRKFTMTLLKVQLAPTNLSKNEKRSFAFILEHLDEIGITEEKIENIVNPPDKL